jgi:uncharacterized membrane protein
MMCRCIYDICMYICIYYIYIICIMAVTENMYQLILGYQIFRQTHTMLCISYIYIIMCTVLYIVHICTMHTRSFEHSYH